MNIAQPVCRAACFITITSLSSTSIEEASSHLLLVSIGVEWQFARQGRGSDHLLNRATTPNMRVHSPGYLYEILIPRNQRWQCPRKLQGGVQPLNRTTFCKSALYLHTLSAVWLDNSVSLFLQVNSDCAALGHLPLDLSSAFWVLSNSQTNISIIA